MNEFEDIKKLHDQQYNASGIEQELETAVKSLENDYERMQNDLQN